MTDNLLYTKSGDTALVQFNRPQAHNAVTMDMYARLEQACHDINADPELRVVVFRGVGGKAFVAGTDIAHFRQFDSGDDAIAYERRIDHVVGLVENLSCTTIAVLEGVCAGGGVPIALGCDFRLADPDLRFGVPIARTLGNCLSISNVARLIDYLGITKTKEMLMLGKMLTAEEALDLRLINQVVQAANLDVELEGLIERIRGLAPLTLQSVKTGMQRTLEARRASAEAGDDYIRRCYTSDDFHGAVAAFLDKQAYRWQGR